MSLGTIFRGNAPLVTFTFRTDSGAVVANLPNNPTKYVVYIHDSTGVRQSAGAVSGSINTTTGILQFQTSALDTANAGVVTWWCTVDLGEPTPRTFDDQEFLIKDPTQG